MKIQLIRQSITLSHIKTTHQIMSGVFGYVSSWVYGTPKPVPTPHQVVEEYQKQQLVTASLDQSNFGTDLDIDQFELIGTALDVDQFELIEDETRPSHSSSSSSDDAPTELAATGFHLDLGQSCLFQPAPEAKALDLNKFNVLVKKYGSGLTSQDLESSFIVRDKQTELMELFHARGDFNSGADQEAYVQCMAFLADKITQLKA